MRGRKLLDQTLPLKAAGTLVSLLERLCGHPIVIPCQSQALSKHNAFSTISPSLSAHLRSESRVSLNSNLDYHIPVLYGLVTL